jgi:prephenate dehydrogenase
MQAPLQQWGRTPGFEFRRVAIVGTGLIGASFALAIRKAGFAGEIVGVSSPPAIADALACGAIDREVGLEAAAAESDLIYLARPIARILDTLPLLEPWIRPDALVTDAGSTKAAIVAAARPLRRVRFLGGHPMAGKERSGAAEADPDLFVGRTYVLTPVEPLQLETPPARELLYWIGRTGAVPTILEPERHDLIVAFTSHLAQLASTALAVTVGTELESPADLAISGPGLADTTRLASSPFEIWKDILDTNREPIERALAAYINTISNLKDNLGTPEVARVFAAAARATARLPRRPRTQTQGPD